jgi:hypothetical protein
MNSRQTQIIMLILSICLLLTLVLALRNNLQKYRPAPGAQTPPGASAFGKVEMPDPGGAFQTARIFKHNVYFSDRDEHKLIPRLNTIYHNNHVNRILYGNTMCIVISFNIIYIIEQWTPNYIWYATRIDHAYTRHIQAASYTIPKLRLSTRLGCFPFLAACSTKTFVCAIAHFEQEQPNV